MPTTDGYIMPNVLTQLTDRLSEWVELPWLVACVAGAWALLNFSRNARVAAADTLLKVEESYQRVLKTLLNVEYVDTYDSIYAPALRKLIGAVEAKERDRAAAALRAHPAPRRLPDELREVLRDQRSRAACLTKVESEAIDDLEAALRHFALCLHISRLGVGRRSMEELCSYYLQVFWDRAELRAYLAVYWPSLYYWSQFAGRTAPQRLLRRVALLITRLRTWWSGSSRPITELGEERAI